MVVASTGFFDGVHIGHRAILRQLSETARERGSESVVVTFWPHPRFILGQDSEKLRLLTTLNEKIGLIKGCGIDEVKVIEFTSELGGSDARSFISQYLVGQYSVDTLVVGYDHRIGRDCLTGRELSDMAGECGIEVINVGEHKVEASHVSSTVIRQEIETGDVKKAAVLLGYAYGIRCLENSDGDGNFFLKPEDSLKIVPADGRYSVVVSQNGSLHKDVCLVKGDIFRLEGECCPAGCEITFLEKLY